MYCSQCGASNEGTSKFCNSCGSPLGQASAQNGEVAAAAPQLSSEDIAKAETLKNTAVTGAVGLGAGLLAGAALKGRGGRNTLASVAVGAAAAGITEQIMRTEGGLKGVLLGQGRFRLVQRVCALSIFLWYFLPFFSVKVWGFAQYFNAYTLTKEYIEGFWLLLVIPLQILLLCAVTLDKLRKWETVLSVVASGGCFLSLIICTSSTLAEGPGFIHVGFGLILCIIIFAAQIAATIMFKTGVLQNLVPWLNDGTVLGQIHADNAPKQ